MFFVSHKFEEQLFGVTLRSPFPVSDMNTGKPWLPCSTELLRLRDYSTGPGIVQSPMIKNVGSMQRQMQKQRHMRPLVERKADPWDAHQKGNGHVRILRLDLDGATPEKKVELIKRIFWSRGKESWRVIAFAGLGAGESCSRMSAPVAEILARSLFGKVCLVDAYLHSLSLCEGFGLRNPCGRANALRSGGASLDFTIPIREGNRSLLPCLRQNLPTPGIWFGPRFGGKLRATCCGAAGHREFTYVSSLNCGCGCKPAVVGSRDGRVIRA